MDRSIPEHPNLALERAHRNQPHSSVRPSAESPILSTRIAFEAAPFFFPTQWSMNAMTDGKESNRKSESRDTPQSSSRRRILTALAAGTGATVLLPEKWVKPVVDKVITPVHAQATVACSAPAGCYTGRLASEPAADEGGFQWPGGQGPETLTFFVPDSNCSTPLVGEFSTGTLVVASSTAEASRLLPSGTAGQIAITEGPSLPAGCSFYIDLSILPPPP